MKFSSKKNIKTWIPESISWIDFSSYKSLIIPASDSDVVMFLANGYIDVNVFPDKKTAKAMATFLRYNSNHLKAALIEQYYSICNLTKKIQSNKTDLTCRFYVWDVFYLPDLDSLILIFGWPDSKLPHCNVSSDIQSLAKKLAQEYMVQLDTIELEKEARRAYLEKIYDDMADDIRERFKSLSEYGDSLNYQNPPSPVLSDESLKKYFKVGVVFDSRDADIDSLNKQSKIVLIKSKILPPRGGDYFGFTVPINNFKTHVIISWRPHEGITSYPEIRWALQRRLKTAMHFPRLDGITPPNIDALEPIEDNTSFSTSVEIDGIDGLDCLNDVNLDVDLTRERSRRSRESISKSGFEAIAWYQPFHGWSEETWGIYFDSEAMDDFALSLFEELRQHKVSSLSTGLASKLAFGLVYAHEYFHAKVEAVASWHELCQLKPLKIKYNKNVYQTLSGTSEWLEEALANWASWYWWQSLKKSIPQSDLIAIQKIIESSLDMSPSGYRDWRIGNYRDTWQLFISQILSGKPKPPERDRALPLESILQGHLPFDFQFTDIPVRFIGKGQIQAVLYSNPANFGVPTRREMERALRYFDHEPSSSGGKGSHEKWTSPDQRAFTLPTRDPVSRTVFTSFLHHVGIDKTTYVCQIRPKL